MGVSREVVKSLIATVELCGAAALSDVARELMEQDLEQYPETSVLMALARCRKELRGRLTLADIIDRIDDGRPGPEQAWSMVSGTTEATTLILTEEMHEAFAAAHPLMAAGDLVAARMTFCEAYRKVALTARAKGLPIKWRVSLGQDPAGRLPAIRAAVEAGLISAADARGLLPAHEADTLRLPEAQARRMLAEGDRRAAAVVNAVPMLGSDRVTPEQIRALADSLKPQRQPSKSIDWAAEQKRLQEQPEQDAG